MTDATPNPEARSYSPKYRRRRRFQGATWTPPASSAHMGDGEWCSVCRKRHGYMSLGLDYERASSGRWKLLWYCKRTGNVIKEQEL